MYLDPKTKSRVCALAIALSAGVGLPALATRMPVNLAVSIKGYLPDAKIRLDGALVAKSGELYLPVLPPNYNHLKGGTTLKVVAVSQVKGQDVDALLFDNGMLFVRVIKKPAFRTLPPLASLDEKFKKAMLGGKLAQDLIVPDEFIVGPEYKSIVGELSITVSGDKKNGPVEPTKHGLGGLYITSPSSGSIILVDEKTLKKIAEYPTEGTPLGMIQVDDKLYIADQSKSRVLIFNTTSRDFAGRQIDLPPKSAPKAVAAIPNGRLLYVSESATGLVDCVETDTGKILLKTKVPPGPSRVVMTPNGNNVLLINVPNGQLSIISTMNQKLVACINVGTSPQALVISSDSKLAYVSCKTSNHVVVIDIVRRMALAGIKSGNGPTGLALTKDGKILYIACAKDNTITAIDTVSKNKIKEVKLPMDVDFPGAIALDPDDKKLYVTSAATDIIGVMDTTDFTFTQVPIGRKSSDIFYARSN